MAASLDEHSAAVLHSVDALDPAPASQRSIAEQTLSRHEQLKELRSQMRDLESQFRQALSTKLYKESEQERIMESITNTTATNEKLKKSLMVKRSERDSCAAVISDLFQDLETCEAETNEDATSLENLEAYMSWFSKFVGLQVTGGEEGVKFVFNKIDPWCPEKEYSFCIKIHDDTYNLIQWDPPINDFEELVKDLNQSGDLLKFVRVAREKFQASVNDVPSVPFSPPMITINRTSEDVPIQSNSRSKNKWLPAKRTCSVSPGRTRRSPRLEGTPLTVDDEFCG